MRNRLGLLILIPLFTISALAEDEVPSDRQGRAEVWLGISSWPALDDLVPSASGSFDTTGYALGGALHIPFKRFASSDLFVGVDGFIAVTESSVNGFIGELTVRHAYLGGSAKWLLGPRRRMSLDAGLGLHLVDMAELSDNVYGLEHEAWESSRAGAFVGATWDFGKRDAASSGGLSLGFKVHFVDFGRVYDEDVFIRGLLGNNAGNLDGPVYMLQIGYSMR